MKLKIINILLIITSIFLFILLIQQSNKKINKKTIELLSSNNNYCLSMDYLHLKNKTNSIISSPPIYLGRKVHINPKQTIYLPLEFKGNLEGKYYIEERDVLLQYNQNVTSPTFNVGGKNNSDHTIFYSLYAIPHWEKEAKDDETSYKFIGFLFFIKAEI